jgi:hypothetical protein
MTTKLDGQTSQTPPSPGDPWAICGYFHRNLRLVEVGQGDELARVVANVPRFYVCVKCGAWSQARVFTAPKVT